MKKEINVATVSKRMDRILTAYKEQVSENVTPPEQSTSTFGQMTYSTERGLELHKTLLNFAVKQNSDSDSELSSDQSYGLVESPPTTTRRRQPQRAVKRTGLIKTSTSAPTKRRKQRKVAATVTPSTSTATVAVTTNNVPGTTAESITASGRSNANDKRRNTK